MCKLYAPTEFWYASNKERSKICNGCGPDSGLDCVPDTIWFLNISKACDIHDYMYHMALPCIGKKEEADRVFLNNMYRIIEQKTKWKWLKFLRRRRAYKYYLAVKHFGGLFFWKNKNELYEIGLV